LAMGVGGQWVVAQGPMTPTGAPGPVMHSLDEVYAEVSSMMTPTTATVSYQHATGASWASMIAVGASQGAIAGDCSAQGRDAGSIPIVGLSHKISNPTNSSGLTYGAHQVHTSFSVLKYFDKASPKLIQAMVNEENLTSVTIKFYRVTGVGGEEQYYTIALSNAVIVDYQWAAPNVERVTFGYVRADWTDENSGNTTNATWTAP